MKKIENDFSKPFSGHPVQLYVRTINLTLKNVDSRLTWSYGVSGEFAYVSREV